MKISFLYILISFSFFLFGCTGFLKPSDQPGVDKQKVSAEKKHKSSAEDISQGKEKPPPSKIHRKGIQVKKEKTEKEEIKHKIALAKQNLDAKKYDKTIEITKKIRSLDPANKTAIFLENEAYYMAGRALVKKGQYAASLHMFGNINEGYKDVKEITASIKTKMQTEAETHYKKGLKYFINEELKKAIAEWEKTLLLNPNHPKAVKDIENAKHLLMELEKIQ